jgi:hypothetical protein
MLVVVGNGSVGPGGPCAASGLQVGATNTDFVRADNLKGSLMM